MPKNMGIIDRVLRVIVAAVLGYLAWSPILNGVAAYIAAGVGVIMLLTSSIAFCPLYLPIKLNTGAKK